VITKEFAGRALAGLGAAHERIATLMYTVDSHAAWTLLRGGLVDGRTARRGEELAVECGRLWAWFGALGDVLERARALAALRRAGQPEQAELAALLTGPVVALDAGGLPVEPTGAVASRITAEQLAAQAEQGATAVLTGLSDVDSARRAVTGEFVRASAELESVASLAAELGEAAVVEPARALAARIEETDLRDPLTSASGGVLAPAARARLADLDAAVARARSDLRDVAAARDAYPARRAALADLVAQVAAAEAGTRAANQRAAEKIAAPGLAAAPADATLLAQRLADLDAVRDTGQWRRLATELSTVEEQARGALARAAELTAAADGLLARRDELRGRLSAFRAKAVAVGLAEDPELTTAHERARELLYTAPCDLRAATQAVHTYSQVLAARSPRRAANRAIEEDR
jgi:hypothetical protein